MPTIQLTPKALQKVANAQKTGKTVQLISFKLTNSTTDDLTTLGGIIYQANISKISNENATTLKVLCLMPLDLNIDDVVSKCFLYDSDGDIFAAGLINSFKYTKSANIEAVINIYMSFSETQAMSLTVESDSFVDHKTFDVHNHDQRYYTKQEIDEQGYQMPFYSMFDGQLGTITDGKLDGFDHNPNVTTNFELYKSILAGIDWDKRDAEEQEILTAMGFNGLRDFAPYQINIIKMTWAGSNHQDHSLGKY